MKFPSLHGKLLEEQLSIDKYSTDMSGYSVRPLVVAIPADEEDVEKLVHFSLQHRIPLTSRGAGSNLSGSAVGEGIMVVFRDMNRILNTQGNRVRVQPGTVYEKLNREMASRGLSLRYDVSSGGWSTLGGNVATKAGGLRSIKYGNVDSSIRNIRFIDSAHGIVDTSEQLPGKLERDILVLRDEIVSDDVSLKLLTDKRRVKSSSGYNLRAFIDHSDPSHILTHLMAGSVGTLGLFTELEMNLVPVPRERILCTAFFKDIVEASRRVKSIVGLEPSAVAVMDWYGTQLVGELNDVSVPSGTGATVLVEFDADIRQKQKETAAILQNTTLGFHFILDGEMAERIWNIRWTMLTHIRRRYEDSEHRFISFVDDMAVPLDHLTPFLQDIYRSFGEEKLKVIIYGHLGEGNLHIRPLIEKKDWKNRVHRIASRCFEIVLSYGGTLTAEHGSGRNRAKYLIDEWGVKIYGYFRKVKEIFDPYDLLNPGVLFSDRDLTYNYRF